MPDEVILVDRNDNPIGFERKLTAHQDPGKLHRAFSVFIFNTEGQMLLQLRSRAKYHFGGLWTNACCSHPGRGEALSDAVHRRLQAEFGFDTGVRKLFSFIYRATDERSGLTEYELDHVFVGTFDGEPQPNPAEIEDWKWMDIEPLQIDLLQNPHRYTPWFRVAAARILGELPAARRMP